MELEVDDSFKVDVLLAALELEEVFDILNKFIDFEVGEFDSEGLALELGEVLDIVDEVFEEDAVDDDHVEVFEEFYEGIGRWEGYLSCFACDTTSR